MKGDFGGDRLLANFYWRVFAHHDRVTLGPKAMKIVSCFRTRINPITDTLGPITDTLVRKLRSLDRRTKSCGMT